MPKAKPNHKGRLGFAPAINFAPQAKPEATRDSALPIRSEFTPATQMSPDIVIKQKVAWRFKKMDGGGVGKCSLKTLDKYLEKLVDYEGRTREEIDNLSHNHGWDVSSLLKPARDRAEHLGIEEEALYQLKLGKVPRLYGIWEHNIFHILWIDENHDKIYECKKKY